MALRIKLDKQKLLGFRLNSDAAKRPLSAMIGSKSSFVPETKKS